MYIVNTSSQEDGKDFPNLVRRVRYLKEESEGVKYMCEILDLEREEGREEGKFQEKISLVRKLLNLMEVLEVAELLELNVNDVRKIRGFIKEHPVKSDEEIVQILMEENTSILL